MSKTIYLRSLILPGLALLSSALFGQDKMDFETYNPKPTLVVKEHLIKRAKYPFIDVHNHQWDMPEQNLRALLKDMDGLNMVAMVNLSGRGGTEISNYHGTSLFTVNGPEYFD